MERAEFAARQAAMTAAWAQNLRDADIDFSTYIDGRKAAYLDRWREAARFIAPGSRVLDLGGGNLWDGLLHFIIAHPMNYWFVDVDDSCVANAHNLAAELGLDPSRFRQGFNDTLEFPAEAFDAIFSSHCLEHSFDLSRTLQEASRVLRPGGNLLFAVPLGWEANPEHPYFLEASDWIALVEDAGFEVRVAQIGREYPEAGWDLFVACRKVQGPLAEARINPAERLKSAYKFLPHDAPAFKHSGNGIAAPDHWLAVGAEWTIDIEIPAGTTEVLPICARHGWSGVVSAEWRGASVRQDLYSWHQYAQPFCLQAGEASSQPTTLSLRPTGRNAASLDSQCAVYGVMLR